MTKVNIFWFRRDLRTFDNTGLFYALTEGIPVLPIFIFDPNILNDLSDRADARVTFIHDEICSIDAQLRKFGSGVRVFNSNPKEVFRNLLETYKIRAVFTNRDYEPYAVRRDSEVEALLREKGVGFYSFKDQVIFEKGEIVTDQKEPYRVFTPFKNKWLEKLRQIKLESFPSEKNLGNLFRGELSEVLSLGSAGFSRTRIPLPKREVSTSIIEKYAEQRNFPAVEGTSKLGVHLRFGTVSIRHLVREGLQHSDVWLSELIWREFYMSILAHFPHVVDRAFKPAYDRIPWINNSEHFEKWCNGVTGYPIVDAGMRELNAIGYMHNRVRMIVASFLTKHLLIDWRWGEGYFAGKLLDFELASNNGGWQWAAGTGTDAQPYFRVFNPGAQTEKFDPHLRYIRKWVPEFQSFDYPKPIVSHSEARERAIKTYKEALS